MDNEIKGEGSSISFRNRIYDPRVTRWLSTDPLQDKYPWISPYNYVSNSPIGKIDVDGLWDIEVHAYKDRGRYGYAVLIVKNRLGKEVLRTMVRVQGMKHRKNNWNPRNRLATYGDTPTGVYKIKGWSNRLVKINSEKYGPNDVLELDYISGEAKESGRNGMHLHGGRQKGINSKTGKAYSGGLWNTGGCMRIKDEELKEIKNITQNLENVDPMEKPGLLTVTDDLVRQDGKYIVPIIDNTSNKSGGLLQTIMKGFKFLKNLLSTDDTQNSLPDIAPKINKDVRKIIDADGDGYTNIRPQKGKGVPKKIRAGTEVEVINQDSNFTRIRYKGQEGYIYNKYIEKK